MPGISPLLLALLLTSSVAGLSHQQTPLTIRPENRRFQLPLDAPENTAVTRGELMPSNAYYQ